MKRYQFPCWFGKFYFEKKGKNIKQTLFHYLLQPKLKQCKRCRKEKAGYYEKPLYKISPYIFSFFKIDDLHVHYI